MDNIMRVFHSMSMDILVGLTHVGIESATHSNGLLRMIYINIDHPHLQHLHEVIIDKTQG